MAGMRLAACSLQVWRSAAQQGPAFGGARTFINSAVAAEAAGKAAEAAAAASSGAKAKRTIQWVLGLGLGVGVAFSYSLFTSKLPQPGALKTQAIASVMDKEDYDDGSYGPVLVRLAWHASGSYDAKTGTGGSNGATMRFPPECEFGANAGLGVARELLEPIKKQFPWISTADLWTLAGATAIEEMGGPIVPWRPGRIDKPDGTYCPSDGRLPDASQGAAHIRAVFGRMGFNDQEMVALSGAHTLGRCHTTRSGYDGPWTNASTTWSNLYFQELTNRHWQKRSWKGPLQYEDKESKKLMMLPTDMALLHDKSFKKYTAMYAKDEEKFSQDFAAAFSKLLELGVEFPPDAKYV